MSTPSTMTATSRTIQMMVPAMCQPLSAWRPGSKTRMGVAPAAGLMTVAGAAAARGRRSTSPVLLVADKHPVAAHRYAAPPVTAMELELRWSALESRKARARPFGVVFLEPGRPPRGLTLTGAELLFYGAFRTAVLEMLGEFVDDPDAEAALDPQRAWLDRLATLMPRATLDAVVPVDHQDELYGMQYRFALRLGGVDAEPPPLVDAGTLLDYQLVQAVIAHQTGALMRLATVESIDDPAARRTAWIDALRPLLAGVDGPNLAY